MIVSLCSICLSVPSGLMRICFFRSPVHVDRNWSVAAPRADAHNHPHRVPTHTNTEGRTHTGTHGRRHTTYIHCCLPFFLLCFVCVCFCVPSRLCCVSHRIVLFCFVVVGRCIAWCPRRARLGRTAPPHDSNQTTRIRTANRKQKTKKEPNKPTKNKQKKSAKQNRDH